MSLFLLCISFEQSDLNRDGYLSLTDGLINIYICKHTQCRYGIYIYFQLDSKSDMCSCSVLLFSFFLYFFLLTSRCIEKVDTNGDQIWMREFPFFISCVYVSMIVITRKKKERNSSINRLHSTVRWQVLLLLIDSNRMKNECRVYIIE